MVSHKHRPEGGSAKGCLSRISLLHSIWDARHPPNCCGKIHHSKLLEGRGEAELGGLRRDSPCALRVWLPT